jgi:surface protein
LALTLLMTVVCANAKTIDLSKATDYSVNYDYGKRRLSAIIAQNNDVLTGKLSADEIVVLIEDGATVYLDGADINSDGSLLSGFFNGITCLGDATIVLRNHNVVKSMTDDGKFAGIYIARGNTLTISAEGNGSLDVATIAEQTYGGAAAIGAKNEGNGGNIIIKSGTITATSARNSAGIGGAENASCGDITIEGGTITATALKEGAGIGGGWHGGCGDITIKGGTIIANGNDAAGIGGGNYSDCGKITITGGTITAKGNTGAGIGGGLASSCGKIVIQGGNVTAIGDRAAGIGCGYNFSDVIKTCAGITISEDAQIKAETSMCNWTIGKGMTEGKTLCGTITIGGEEYPNGVKENPFIYPKETCATPGKPTVTEKTHNSATVTWTAPSEQIKWYITRKSENQDDFYAGGYTNVKSYTFQHLQANTQYEVKVKAICGEDEESEYSESLFFTTDPEPCYTPIDLTVTGKTHKSATITWKTQSGNTPAKWTVKYGKKGQAQTTATATQPTFTMTGLTAETEYEVRVQANCDASDESAFTDPVYFTTDKVGAIVYTVFYNMKLTYYYDENYGTHIGAIEEEYDPSMTRFESYYENVQSAEIDASMKNVALTSMRSMFYGGAKADKTYALKNMTFINGLQNLNTSELTDTYYMFYKCQSLTSLDLRKFDMSKVTNAYRMFEFCSSLTTITCDEDWSQYTALTQSGNMFSNCSAIKGGQGTTYNSSYIDKSYARPDGGTEAPGYFTKDAERIAQCELKGFEGKITYGMEWTKAAGNAVASGIVAVDAGAPYSTSANTWYLYKWNEDEEKWKQVSSTDGIRLDDGDYYFRIQLLIPNDKRSEFYFSPDKEDLSVTVDDELWTVDDMIGSGRSYVALINSREFTLEKVVDPEIEEAKEQLEAWADMAMMVAMYFESKGETAKAEELTNIALDAQAVCDNDLATLDEVNAAIATTSAAVEPYGEELIAFYKQSATAELENELQPDDSDACKQIIADAIAAVNALTWDPNKSFEENLMAIIEATSDIFDKAWEDLNAQREKEQGIEDINIKSAPRKILMDGTLYIIRDGKVYTATGAVVK